jgi:1-acyl-sn-glycerol-3-phosphate acyltransferase
MAARKALLPIRVFRLVHMAGLLINGLSICKFRFPKLSTEERNVEIRRWSISLLRAAGMQVRPVGAPDHWPGRAMIVSNHISWIDVFAVLAVAPGVFVAKSEIQDWPLIGRLVTAVDTLYIAREKKSDVLRMNQSIVAALEAGRRVAICPEGTTTWGDELLRFHAALFQPAIQANATLHPIGLRYLDASGRPTRAAGYVGEMSLVRSIWRIVSERTMVVEVRFAPPVDATGSDRRTLARETEQLICDVLGLAGSRQPPETPGDPPT